MKVYDFQAWRTKKSIFLLEKRIAQLVTNSQTGAVHEIKTCFKEWLAAARRQ